MNQDLNVVIIVSDQHKRAAMGCSGNPYVKTPNLDELAKNGITFTNAYCSSPVCAPTRAAFMTSTMPYKNTALFHIVNVNGKMHSSGHFRRPGYRPELTTMGEYFKEQGYATAAIGKMHVHGETRENDMGFDTHKLRFYSFDFQDYESALDKGDPALALQKRVQYTAAARKEKGYDYSWTGQFNNKENCPAAIDTMKDSVMTEEDMIDVMTTKASMKFIEDHKDEKFLLHVGLEKPHPPWTEVSRFIDQYNHEDLPDSHLPAAWNESKRDFVLNWLYQQPEKKQIKMAQAAYYANVTSMDEKVGQIIEKLKKEGLYEKTVIIYTTDHGEMCYEHAQVEKHCMYEAAVNIPLIISCPAKLASGVTSQYLVSHIDILPTLGALCDFPMADSFQGESLKPVLQQPSLASTGKAVYSEFLQPGYCDHPDNSSQDDYDARVPLRMIRDDQWKYIFTSKLADQLYSSDSNEIFEKDNCCTTHPDMVKKLKRCVLAGWDTGGYLGVVDDEKNLEELLGSAHLDAKLSYQQDLRGHHLTFCWTSKNKIGTWCSEERRLVSRSVSRYCIYSNNRDDIYTASCLHTLHDFGIRKWELTFGSLPEKRYYWIIAETEKETLGASNLLILDAI